MLRHGNASEFALESYDIVTLIPIIEQAAGLVTTLDVNRAEKGGPILHEQVLHILNHG